jgi:hypothetical protein
VKEYSKGTGYIKEEHKFPPSNSEDSKKKERETNFLNMEDTENLQDMINYAASVSHNEKAHNIYPIESLYSQVLNKETSGAGVLYTNEKIDNMMADILKR